MSSGNQPTTAGMSNPNPALDGRAPANRRESITLANSATSKSTLERPPQRVDAAEPGRFASHIRLFNFQLRTPDTLMVIFETALLYGVAATAANQLAANAHALMPALLTLTLIVTGIAMGLYSPGQRDRTIGLTLRAGAAFAVLTPLGLLGAHLLLPGSWFALQVLAATAAVALTVTVLSRSVLARLINTELFKRRVLVLGAGPEAQRISQRMRRKTDRRGFHLVGFVPATPEQTAFTNSPETPLFDLSEMTLLELCRRHYVDEIVVAWGDRRGSGPQRLPLDALLACKMSGIAVTELPTFFEREARRIDVDILRPSWLLFSEGFAQPLRTNAKRLFDVAAALLLLAVTWPLMLLSILAIKLEDGFRGPVLYRQRRVGLNGRTYEVLKFRSMVTDAESFGEAVWAEADDPRITRTGRMLRKLRIDELPQLFNILKGEMAFVGPRPERPVFVERFARDIPFYAERHRVKPGLTGWAQINYPYGASDEDAKRKLEFDLYYVKNYSMLLDLYILTRTAEVVLVGNGAR